MSSTPMILMESLNSMNRILIEPLYNHTSLNLKNNIKQYLLNMDTPIPPTMDTQLFVSETVDVVPFTAVGGYDVFDATDLVLVVVFAVTSVYQTKSLFWFSQKSIINN